VPDVLLFGVDASSGLACFNCGGHAVSVSIQLRTLVAFATGLAVALIAVFVFQAWRVDAAPGDTDATFVPITPCRLVDTRPSSQVGTRGTPIGADETHQQQVTGTIGDCTIPTTATSVSMNVTAVNSTAPSFMTLFPFDAPRPWASNLNYSAGSPPTPNKVDVKLSADGKVGVYNLAGTVDLVADIAGYYTQSSLQEINSRLAALEAAGSVTNLDTSNEPGISSTYAATELVLTTTPLSVASTSIRAPSDGYVEIEVTGAWYNSTDSFDSARCQLQKGAVGAVDINEPWFALDDHNTDPGWNGFAAHRIMSISVADNPPKTNLLGQQLRLVCVKVNGAVSVGYVHISGTFFATSYQPIGRGR
jgi:hypothetical protein